MSVKSSYKIKPKDILKILKISLNEIINLSLKIYLTIVYEDDYLVIKVNEPGMVVHPSYGHYTGTLLNALKFHIDKLAECEDATRPGLVHRIDKTLLVLLLLQKLHMHWFTYKAIL